MHQLVNKSNFHNIKIHGMNVKEKKNENLKLECNWEEVCARNANMWVQDSRDCMEHNEHKA